MKKTLIGLIIAMFSFGSASADAGVNIGVSGNAALYAATATELDQGSHGTTTGSADETNSESEFLGLGYASVFIEGSLGPILVGFDYVPSSIDTETASTEVDDKTTSATSSDVTNTVKVEFNDLTTAYIGLKIMDRGYIKIGVASVDLETKENLGTGSSYGNTSVDGTMIGAGMQHTMDNGVFLRAEANVYEFDSVSLTSSSGSQKITLDSLDGVVGKVSIGKTF